ncbi:MAG: radical SAM protein [Candidatus Omnitrophota bacterium]
MKILVLNPPFVNNFCRSARWAARSRGRVQRHPDWLLIACAVLEQAGHSVRFIDGAALNLKREDIEKQVLSFMPQMAVLHTTTPTINNDILYAKLIKQITGCTTVLVGAHVTAEVRDTFNIAAGAVDVVARGEYDYALRDLSNGVSIKQILGISYFKDGFVINNPERGLIDVNELPYPAWHLVRPEWYYDGGKRFPFLTLISGRGCFGACTFCRDTPLLYKRELRLRNVKLVADEIEYDYKLFPYIKEIMFETDTFTASAQYVTAFCEEVLKRGLKFCWSCNTRVDIDLSVLPLMKRAGCRMLMTGFEFGTQRALDAVHKGITLEQSVNFARAANKLGFVIHGCFMLGAPGETRESCQETIDFAKSLPLDTVQISGICAYPGTDIYNWAKKNGYLVPKSWDGWVAENYEQATILSYSNLTKEDIDKYINKGLREFYLRPSQIFRILSRSGWNDLRRLYIGLKGFLSSCFKSQ